MITQKILSYFKTSQGIFLGSFVGVFILFLIILALVSASNNESLLLIPIFLIFGFFVFWGIVYPIWKFVKAFKKEGWGLFTRFYDYVVGKIKEFVQGVVSLVLGLIILVIVAGVGIWIFGKVVEFYQDMQIPSEWTLFYYATAQDQLETTSKVPGYSSKTACIESGVGLINSSEAMRRGAWFECGYKCKYISDLRLTQVCKEVCDSRGNCSK